MDINVNCDGLYYAPLWVLFLSVFFLGHFIPLLYFYANWYSKYRRGLGDIKIGNTYFYIPSISKTWRNFNSIYPVFAGTVIVSTVYSVCFNEAGNIVCLLLGILLALFVFSFNDEDGPISKVHGVFAFGFFAYLLWLVYALSIYVKDGVIWWWPYIPMGGSILAMLTYSIIYMFLEKNKDGFPVKYVKMYENEEIAKSALSHWPSWVSACEHIFVFSFEIYMLTIISKYEL